LQPHGTASQRRETTRNTGAKRLALRKQTPLIRTENAYARLSVDDRNVAAPAQSSLMCLNYGCDIYSYWEQLPG
jgi:hypothetical protein